MGRKDGRQRRAELWRSWEDVVDKRVTRPATASVGSGLEEEEDRERVRRTGLKPSPCLYHRLRGKPLPPSPNRPSSRHRPITPPPILAHVATVAAYFQFQTSVHPRQLLARSLATLFLDATSEKCGRSSTPSAPPPGSDWRAASPTAPRNPHRMINVSREQLSQGRSIHKRNARSTRPLHPRNLKRTFRPFLHRRNAADRASSCDSEHHAGVVSGNLTGGSQWSSVCNALSPEHRLQALGG